MFPLPVCQQSSIGISSSAVTGRNPAGPTSSLWNHLYFSSPHWTPASSSCFFCHVPAIDGEHQSPLLISLDVSNNGRPVHIDTPFFFLVFPTTILLGFFLFLSLLVDYSSIGPRTGFFFPSLCTDSLDCFLLFFFLSNCPSAKLGIFGSGRSDRIGLGNSLGRGKWWGLIIEAA